MLIQESEETSKQEDSGGKQTNEPAFKDRSSTDHLVHGTKQLASAIPSGITFAAIATAVTAVLGESFSTVKLKVLQVLIYEAVESGDWNKVIKGYSEVGITAIELVAILSLLGIPLIGIGPLISSDLAYKISEWFGVKYLDYSIKGYANAFSIEADGENVYIIVDNDDIIDIAAENYAHKQKTNKLLFSDLPSMLRKLTDQPYFSFKIPRLSHFKDNVDELNLDEIDESIQKLIQIFEKGT